MTLAWTEAVLLGFDLETTGADPLRDLPVQVALVRADPGGEVASTVFLVDPGGEVPAEATAIHGITTEMVRESGVGLREATVRLHTALRAAEQAGTPLVAMNAAFDLTIAERLFRTEGLSPLGWVRVLDPLVMDRHLDRFRRGPRKLAALCDHYGVTLEGAHDAASDAFAAVELVRVLGRRFPEVGALDATELTRRHALWHREWASGYDGWRRGRGQRGLGEEEFEWPVRGRRGAGRPAREASPS
jgi:DNA polymerase-3 subunit epsilon